MPPAPLFIFQRIEKKYLLTEACVKELLSLIGTHLTPDPHGRSTVQSLYLDTPDFRLIRASIDATCYKEKLRLRSYGTPSAADPVFFELKKKYRGVVYKRRVRLTQAQAQAYLATGHPPLDSQIMRELDCAMRFYDHPAPAAMICCEREAYFCVEDPTLRLTLDRNIRYRLQDLSLSDGAAGKALLDADGVLLEIKTSGAMPLWLTRAMDALGVFPTSFSKYGTAYLDYLKHTLYKGEPIHA